MSDDPAHKAMLYFLEILMNSNGPLTISQLAGRFGSRTFTNEMRTACGGNEPGLKKFLLKYPSLFMVRGNMVSLFDGKSTPEYPDDEPVEEKALRRRSLPDVSLELQAVSFFQSFNQWAKAVKKSDTKGKLAKKEERWVSIKSLAGHLSQASNDVRNIVGPQLEFRAWLLKHPHIFDVQGELVGLCDGMAALSTPALSGRTLEREARPLVPPKTPPAQRRVAAKSPAAIRRSRSFGERLTSANNSSAFGSQSGGFGGDINSNTSSIAAAANSVLAKKRAEPITMTANEYKAVIFLKEAIEKQGGSLLLHDIASHYGTTSDPVRTTVGWTRPEQEEFIRNNSSIFVISDEGRISLVKNAKLNVIITGSKPTTQAGRTLTSRKGEIFHVAKLWGIIDLGQHEHVFFDKSIMRRPIDDMTKYFNPGDTLCFNAVLAPKSSRAKWRATHVWKELESQPSGSESDLSNPDQSSGMLSPAISVEEEINKFLPRRPGESESTTTSAASPTGYSQSNALQSRSKYRDAAPSGAGVVPIYNFSLESDGDTGSERSLTIVPESYQMSSSSLRDISSAEYNRAIRQKPVSLANGVNGTAAKYVNAACQTVSTGDIIATQLVYES